MNSDKLALWAEEQPQSGGPARAAISADGSPDLVFLLLVLLQPPTSPTVATHKAGRVVIPQGLGIAKSLHGRVSLNDLILEGTLQG